MFRQEIRDKNKSKPGGKIMRHVKRGLWILSMVSLLWGRAEVFIKVVNLPGGSTVTFTATPVGPTYDRYAALGNFGTVAFTANTDGSYDAFDMSVVVNDNPLNLPQIGYGLYRFTVEGPNSSDSFYYDTRDCNYWPGNNTYSSPDIGFIFNASTGQFSWNSSSLPVRSISDSSTVYMWWVLEDQPGVDFANYVPDQSCFYADITLTNKYGNDNIGDFITVDNLTNPVQSGTPVNLLRGEEREFTATEIITFNSLDLKHHDWIEDNSRYKLTTQHTPDNDLLFNSWFDQPKTVTLTTGTNFNVPIFIHDPWYVEPDGRQLDRFHVLNATENPGGSYKVFKDEGNPSVVSTWSYAVSAPSLNYTHNGTNYLFTGWSASGADLAPYPGQETDPLIRKVLFKQAGAVVTANYMRLDAMDGVISRDMNFSGNLTVSGTVTIAQGADVTFSAGAVVRFNPGTAMIVKGNLTADYATFTRADPNSSSRNYWDGITVESGGRLWLVNGTVEGATQGLFGNYGDARASNSTFRENDTGFYLDHVDTYYSHHNTFTNNNYGVRFHYSNVPFHNNTFINNTYDGLHVLKSTGKIEANTFASNSSAGVRILNQSGISLTDLRLETDVANINNVIEHNGSYGIYVDATSGPDLGTYSQYWKNGYIYGGFNRFNRGTGGYDIYSLYSGTIRAEMNWWDTEVLYGNISVIPRAINFGGGGGPAFKILGGGDSGGDAQTDSLEWLLMTANALAADSLYDEAVAAYRALIDSVPSNPLSAIALTRLFGTYKQAKLDTVWNTLLNDSTLLLALNEIHTKHGGLRVGLAAYDFTITLNAFLGQFPEALNRGDQIIKTYAESPEYKEALAHALFEQGGIYEHLSGKDRQAGKIKAGSGYSSLAESNYDRILRDHPQTEAAGLVRMLKGMGETEDETGVENIPKTFKLHPAYPNPFNPSTTIQYLLPENGHVTLTIYDLLGKEVKTLVKGNKGTGFQKVQWDGKNQNGHQVPAGIYFYKLIAQSNESGKVFSKSMKMV